MFTEKGRWVLKTCCKYIAEELLVTLLRRSSLLRWSFVVGWRAVVARRSPKKLRHRAAWFSWPKFQLVWWSRFSFNKKKKKKKKHLLHLVFQRVTARQPCHTSLQCFISTFFFLLFFVLNSSLNWTRTSTTLTAGSFGGEGKAGKKLRNPGFFFCWPLG